MPQCLCLRALLHLAHLIHRVLDIVAAYTHLVQQLLEDLDGQHDCRI